MMMMMIPACVGRTQGHNIGLQFTSNALRIKNLSCYNFFVPPEITYLRWEGCKAVLTHSLAHQPLPVCDFKIYHRIREKQQRVGADPWVCQVARRRADFVNKQRVFVACLLLDARQPVETFLRRHGNRRAWRWRIVVFVVVILWRTATNNTDLHDRCFILRRFRYFHTNFHHVMLECRYTVDHVTGFHTLVI